MTHLCVNPVGIDTPKNYSHDHARLDPDCDVGFHAAYVTGDYSLLMVRRAQIGPCAALRAQSKFESWVSNM
jgi:hypothetical protein